jgi:hypothetical protein
VSAVLALGSIGLLGCGGASPGMSSADVRQMRHDVAAARAAAARGAPDTAIAALNALTGRIVAARAAGRLAPDRARTLLTLVRQARARVATDVTPAAPAATSAPTELPTPAPWFMLPVPGAGDSKNHGDSKNQGDGGD